MLFRPFSLVILYFLILGIHGFVFADIGPSLWATMNTWHEFVGVLAGFCFAFKNEPEDKTAMLVLVAYILGLAVFDPFIETYYSIAGIIICAVAVGGIFHFRRVALAMYRNKETG